MKCNHGGGSCSENVCQGYCDEHSQCTHFRSSVLGECQIFSGCTRTYWRAHTANTYQRCVYAGPSPIPTRVPSPYPTPRPTSYPIFSPTRSPTSGPSFPPSNFPSSGPTSAPSSDHPSQTPTSAQPSATPSSLPSDSQPSAAPTTFCPIFEMKCDSPSLFEGEYTRQSVSDDLGELKLWMRKNSIAFEQLPLNGDLTWVFRSSQAGLLIAKHSADDFRSIQEWTPNFINSVWCNINCLQSYYPTQLPTYAQPTLSPSKKPRYKIEVEHHLSGLTKQDWGLYEVDKIYVDAMSFVFDVPNGEVEIISVDSLSFQKRRLLKTQMIIVHAAVSFTDHKRFEEFRDILQSVKGRASMNSYFNFLLTDKNSDLDNMHLEHMGIEGDFDMVAYFTTTVPSSSPSYGDFGSAMNAQKEVSERTDPYMVLTFSIAIIVLVIVLWRCLKDQLFKNADDEITKHVVQQIIPVRSNAVLGSVPSASSIYSPEGKLASPQFSFALGAIDDNEGFVTMFSGEENQCTGTPGGFAVGLQRKATTECSDLVYKDSLLKELPSQSSGLSESDTEITVYHFDANTDGETGPFR